MNWMDKKVILTLADCNMNITQTSEKLYMHRNSVVYHIKRIKKQTGLNPLNFYDLCKLVSMAKEETAQ